ncbi:putative hydro-lyase [Sporolactobacillus shoreicorticis]|uniref:Putative hydro-lyase ACFSUE_13320 n=1 Tax=Sporolactobacillus shoreicorticis TaxID=1923877 RepID=A0ABW5S4A5_9BACL|nr:putative hydro-lyase [Sporolactobacillus shoreicorticis]MCO7127180.1 putative hydro-lyase [Sporolactobacillus shoreicorticis]
MIDYATLAQESPSEVRHMIRKGQWDQPTSGLANGHTQANLVILPADYAYDFLLFCQRNPQPCPLLEVLDTGDPIVESMADHADIRTDIPRYRIYSKGILSKELTDIRAYWRDDFVSFLIGCSFSFEQALLENGIPVRQIEEQRNVPMYRTNIPCKSAGIFSGPVVVSMRPMTERQAIRAIQVTSRYPSVHGAPIHFGNPEKLGIRDLAHPDFGDAVTIREGEIPVFWACGVTPQAAVMDSRPDIAITHAPGHMFITDQKDTAFSIL